MPVKHNYSLLMSRHLFASLTVMNLANINDCAGCC